MIETQYHIISNALPPELCDHLIIENFLYSKGEDAKVFNKKTNDYDTDNAIRNTEVVFHPCKSDLGKFFKQNCRAVNKEADWYFNIDRIESIQILKYQPGSFYNTHIDLRKPKKGKGFHQKQRKISCILLLNNPDEYIGGDLILFPFDSKLPVNLSETLTKGDLLVFPSFIPHKIEEVVSGYRYSATAWIEGLSFR
tara:strand:+ start:131 stop:718 length:588 start_codon:yes stop_codon:yes gene_type:complete